jgi:flagellar protein FlaG
MNTVTSARLETLVRPEPQGRPRASSGAVSTPQSASISSSWGNVSENVSFAHSRPSLEKAIEQIQRYLKDSGSNLSLAFDEGADRYVAKVVNSATGEVVRSIPSEEVLELARTINDKLSGLVNQRA